jgi:hypothetical protein
MADFSMIPVFEHDESKVGEKSGEEPVITRAPLIKLRPVHSTWDVTTIREDALLAHVMHVRVLTLNTPPLGTSGVRVVVSVTT